MSRGKKTSEPSGKASTVERIITAAAGIAGIISLFVGIYGTFVLPNKSNDNREPMPDPTPTVTIPRPALADIHDFADNDERLAYAADLIGHGWYEDATVFLKSFQETVESGSEIELAIRFNLGLAHLYRENWNEAINNLEVVARRTSYPDAYYNLGRAYMGLNQADLALEAFEKALGIEQKPEYQAAKDAAISGTKESSAVMSDGQNK